MRILSILCGLWFAVMAGFYFAFSIAVMPALQQSPDTAGMTTMQSLNHSSDHPLFVLGFWGAMALAMIGSVLALRSRCEGWVALTAGCVLYLIASVGVTLLGNLPMNNELALLGPESANGLGVWLKYLQDWTLLNQLRTVLCMAAAAFALIPLLHMPMNYWRVAG